MTSGITGIDVFFHPTDVKKIACRACNFGRAPAEYTWQQKTNWRKHILVKTHQEALQRRNERERVARETALQYTLFFQSRPVSLQVPLASSVIPQPPAEPSTLSHVVEEINARINNEFDSMTSAEINMLYPVSPTDEERAERIQSIIEAEFQLERMQDQILEEK